MILGLIKCDESKVDIFLWKSKLSLVTGTGDYLSYSTNMGFQTC